MFMNYTYKIICNIYDLSFLNKTKCLKSFDDKSFSLDTLFRKNLKFKHNTNIKISRKFQVFTVISFNYYHIKNRFDHFFVFLDFWKTVGKCFLLTLIMHQGYSLCHRKPPPKFEIEALFISYAIIIGELNNLKNAFQIYTLIKSNDFIIVNFVVIKKHFGKLKLLLTLSRKIKFVEESLCIATLADGLIQFNYEKKYPTQDLTCSYLIPGWVYSTRI
ncbi:hypothetical protein AGLY_015457 [Aphis glycines]|uniref:Uncharacterized protein n=1 Tax=Aphis glycines TaxID=307491 RepID=A0A6G0T0R0_APHGL|nr:hypothetical protein AGLY_015457 [Aphis glycines]